MPIALLKLDALHLLYFSNHPLKTTRSDSGLLPFTCSLWSHFWSLMIPVPFPVADQSCFHHLGFPGILDSHQACKVTIFPSMCMLPFLLCRPPKGITSFWWPLKALLGIRLHFVVLGRLNKVQGSLGSCSVVHTQQMYYQAIAFSSSLKLTLLDWKKSAVEKSDLYFVTLLAMVEEWEYHVCLGNYQTLVQDFKLLARYGDTCL